MKVLNITRGEAINERLESPPQWLNLRDYCSAEGVSIKTPYWRFKTGKVERRGSEGKYEYLSEAPRVELRVAHTYSVEGELDDGTAAKVLGLDARGVAEMLGIEPKSVAKAAQRNPDIELYTTTLAALDSGGDNLSPPESSEQELAQFKHRHIYFGPGLFLLAMECRSWRARQIKAWLARKGYDVMHRGYALAAPGESPMVKSDEQVAQLVEALDARLEKRDEQIERRVERLDEHIERLDKMAESMSSLGSRKRKKIAEWRKKLVHHAWVDYGCSDCGWRIGEPEIGHITPHALGGGDTLENLMPICRHCNIKNAAKLYDKDPRPPKLIVEWLYVENMRAKKKREQREQREQSKNEGGGLGPLFN